MISVIGGKPGTGRAGPKAKVGERPRFREWQAGKRTPQGRFTITYPRDARCAGRARAWCFSSREPAVGIVSIPLSEERRGRDVTYANEREVKSTEDILEEARLIGALGTGITGGEPLMRSWTTSWSASGP